MKYQTIRREYQHHGFRELVFIDPYAMLLSPFVTNLCLKLNLIPNVVTLCMMVSGVIGAVLFALPFLWAKIAGTVFIHLWYVFDCSDGEVARITKKFSKFGTEIDYAAHVINHPLFLFAFLCTLLGAGTGFSSVTLCLIFFGIVALNLVYRNTVFFRKDYSWKMNDPQSAAPQPKKFTLKDFVTFFSGIFVQLPNYCLIFPIVYFVSPRAAVWYSIIVLCFCIVFVPISLLGWLRRIVFK
jgi:phosphatidylglycerophosphate synthase